MRRRRPPDPHEQSASAQLRKPGAILRIHTGRSFEDVNKSNPKNDHCHIPAPGKPVTERLEVTRLQVEPDDSLAIAEETQSNGLERGREVLLVVPLGQSRMVIRSLDRLGDREEGVEVIVERGLRDSDDLVEAVHVGRGDNLLPGRDAAIAVSMADSSGMGVAQILVLAPEDFILLLLTFADEATVVAEGPPLIEVIDDMELRALENLKVVLAEEVDDIRTEQQKFFLGKLINTVEVAVLLVELSG